MRTVAVIVAAVPVAVLAFFFVQDLCSGVVAPYRWAPAPHPQYPELGLPWAMGPVDNPGDWLPNGLDSADVNGDGLPDLLVNYEWTGRIRVVFHPGAQLRNNQPWPAVDLGWFPNAENAAFGDLDADGTVDVIVAQGVEHHGAPSGLRVLWGRRLLSPPTNPWRGYWEDGGLFPASTGLGHYLAVKVADVDGDGWPDVVAGGRADRTAGGPKTAQALKHARWAGLRWFRNPGGMGLDPRNLAHWGIYGIAPRIPSGHGFVLADLNGDGFVDLVVNNADWDTLEEEEAVLVYWNPGTERIYAETWPCTELYRSPEFYGKEQVAVGDLDGDGFLDVVGQSQAWVHVFRQEPGRRFRHERIAKHPALRWRSRPIALADLNGDGHLDIVGAAIHRDGFLPKDVAAVWWLEQTPQGWVPHVIKWGSGFFGLGTFNGEKWDQILPMDVDGDGDLDLVANVEEFNRLRSVLAVVWFRNPGALSRPGTPGGDVGVGRRGRETRCSKSATSRCDARSPGCGQGLQQADLGL